MLAAATQAPMLTSQAVDEYLEENGVLLDAIQSAQQAGNMRASLSYMLRLQQNLLFLGVHADRFGEPKPLAGGPLDSDVTHTDGAAASATVDAVPAPEVDAAMATTAAAPAAAQAPVLAQVDAGAPSQAALEVPAS
jgi:hypothetical protein